MAQHISKPRNNKDFWEPPVDRRGKKGFFPRDFGGSIVLMAPLFLASILQNYERINFCSFVHLVLITLLLQLWKTNIESMYTLSQVDLWGVGKNA